MIDSMEQFVLPGEHEIHFEKTGKYTVFQEFISGIEGVSFEQDPLKGLDCFLTPVDSDELIPIGSISEPGIYFSVKRCGYSVLWFKIYEPGWYVFSGYYPRGDKRNDIGNQAVFTICHAYGEKNRILIFYIVGIFLSGIAAIVVIITVWRKRARAARARTFTIGGG